MTLAALTPKGAQIPKAFADRKHALQWAEENAPRWPGLRIVQTDDNGKSRTIWREQRDAAGA